VAPVPAGNTFLVAPSAAGSWILSARAVVSGRALAFGPGAEVVAVTAPPSTYAAWAAGFESGAGLPAGTLANSVAADYNHDGVANLMAYALGLSPVSPSAGGLPQAVVSGGSLRLEYPKDTLRGDVVLTPEISTNLQTWFAPGQAGAPAGFADTLVSTSGTVQTRRASVPVSAGQKIYLRLRATKN
jgi:hypothetical protein